MHCQYCGNEFWASRVIGDSDFCSPLHRRRFQNHLKSGMQRIEESTSVRSTRLAPFQTSLGLNEASRASVFSVASYIRPVRIPSFDLIPTAEAVAPALASSQPTRFDERIRISAILSEVRQELAQRRHVGVPRGSRGMDRVIELAVAV